MHIGDQQIPRQKPINPQPTCYRLLTSRDIKMPASSQMIIPGKLDKPANSTVWGILELPNTTNLLVGKALVDLQREGVPVRVLNISDQPKRLKKGMIWLHAHLWRVCLVLPRVEPMVTWGVTKSKCLTPCRACRKGV